MALMFPSKPTPSKSRPWGILAGSMHSRNHKFTQNGRQVAADSDPHSAPKRGQASGLGDGRIDWAINTLFWGLDWRNDSLFAACQSDTGGERCWTGGGESRVSDQGHHSVSIVHPDVRKCTMLLIIGDLRRSYFKQTMLRGGEVLEMWCDIFYNIICGNASNDIGIYCKSPRQHISIYNEINCYMISKHSKAVTYAFAHKIWNF